MADGTTKFVIADLVQGTATDNFGAAYTFTYHNTTIAIFDGQYAHMDVKDSFILNGGNVNLNVGVNWRWLYPADSLEVAQFFDGNGQVVNIELNPLFWPTNDGIHEAPEIVPGSWQVVSARGDTWNCDPI